MNTEKSNKKERKFTIFIVIVRFLRWLHPACPNCKEGRLYNKDVYYVGLGVEVNVWECDKCIGRFV
jgi:uncharacterized protein (DUF983 family)